MNHLASAKSGPTEGHLPRAAGRLALALLLTVGTAGQEAQTGPTPVPDAAGGGTLANLSLQELLQVRYDKVYSASRREQSLRDAPASVTIVTAEDIKVHGYRSLAEILQSVPGLYVTYDRSYHFLGLRGFSRPGDYNSRVLLLVDGVRMNDAVYDSALIEAESIPGEDLIERVEVVHGPASAVYGSSAFFGVVNIVTKRGAQVGGIQVAGEYGTFDSYKGRFTYGTRTTAGLDVLLSATYLDNPGPRNLYYPEYDNPAENHGWARNRDGEQAQDYVARIGYGDFSFFGAFNRRDKAVPTGAFGTFFNDPRTRIRDDTAVSQLTYERTFENELALTARLKWQHYAFDSDAPYAYANPPADPEVVVNAERDRSGWWGGEVQLNRAYGKRVNATLGGEWRHNYRQDLTYEANDDPARPRILERRQSLTFGLFAQVDVAILTNLTLSAGGRYDHYDALGDAANPRIALNYRPWAPTTLKALFGQAFRAPNVYELYASYPGVQKGNPDLRPETIRTYELVWEQQLTRALQASLSGYHYDVADLISQELDLEGLLVFRNLDSVAANGGSITLSGAWANGWSARASYSVQRAEDGTTGEALSNSPLHLAKLQARIPLWKDKISAGPELFYVGRKKTVQGGAVADYWLANLTLLAENVVKNLDASVSLYNLFDQRYAHPVSPEDRQAAIRQDGLTFRVKLTYRF